MIYFRETDPKKYVGGYKRGSIYTTVNVIRRVIGEPFYATDKDYPDDPNKTTMCIMVVNSETNNVVLLWSYRQEVEDADKVMKFSVYYEDEGDFENIQDLLMKELFSIN